MFSNKKSNLVLKICVVILLQFNIYICFGQNLVQNSGFEDTISCPNLPGQINNCKGWSNYGNTPDYFNLCDVTNFVGVPLNYFGYQNALSGNAYCGIVTKTPLYHNNREMIGRQLITPLIKNNKYYASFHVSLGEFAKYTSNNIGISFSTVSRANNNNSFVNENRPFVYTKSIIKDYTNWVNISGSFVSDSNYQYIIIGNFYSDSLTIHENSTSASADGLHAYYYIDDVCVSLDSLTCVNRTGIKTLQKGKNIMVYPNPFIDQVTFKSNAIDEGEIVIFDLLSKEIERHAFSDTITLDLEYLPKGIYYYEISNHVGVIERGKLVKG